MKKILLTLSALTVFSAPTSYVVSCSRFPDGMTDGNGQGEMSPNNNFNKEYYKDYNYVTGPSNDLINKINNEQNTQKNDYFNLFVGDSKSLYSVYNYNNGKPYFYGDKNKLMKMPYKKENITLWKNDEVNRQIILLSKKDFEKIEDLKIELVSDNDILKQGQEFDENKIIVDARFTKFMRTNKPGVNSKRLLNEQQLMPDSIGENYMDALKYDVQPIWLNIKTGKNINFEKASFKIDINFKVNGKKDNISQVFDLNIKQKSIENINNQLSDQWEENDSFGFSATSYPMDGIKQFKDSKEYENSSFIDEQGNKKYKEKSLGLNYLESNSFKLNLNELYSEFNIGYVDDVKLKYINKDNVIDFSFDKDELNVIIKNDKDDTVGYFVLKDNNNQTYILNLYINSKGIIYSDNPDNIGPENTYSPWFMRDPQKAERLDLYLKGLEEINSEYLFGVGFHKQLISYHGHQDIEGFKDEDYINLYKTINSDKKFADFLKRGKWKWEFDFSNLKRYMEFAAKHNIKKVAINTMDVGGLSFYYSYGRNKKGNQTDFYKGINLINPNNGKSSPSTDTYLSVVHSELMKQLSKFLNENKNNEELRLSKNKNEMVKLALQFDEINEEVAFKTMDNVRKNELKDAPKILSNYFIGWRSDLSNRNDGNRIDYVNKIFEDDRIDNYIIHFREFSNKWRNEDIQKLADLIQKRKEKGLKTSFYSTFNVYPGAYLQSDLAEEFWTMLFTRRMNLNNFVRWAYDKIYPNINNVPQNKDSYDYGYYETEIVDLLKKGENESGQSFLIYGGNLDQNRIYYSTRMKVYKEALNYMYKINYYLNKDNIKDKQDLMKYIKINKALHSIGFTTNFLQNNDFKYSRETIDTNSISSANNDYQESISEQVYKIVKMIDELE